MATSQSGTRPEASAGRCVDSKLGIWLAGTGGSFHPRLVFRPSPEDRTSASDMGMAVYADQAINKREVLASCPLEAIISRQSCLERIAKLFEQGPFRNQSGQGITSFENLSARWLDRTVISFYLMLTKLSLASQNLESRELGANLVDQTDRTKNIFKSAGRIIHQLFSFHQEYVTLLPDLPDLMTPLFWKAIEIEQLRSTSLYRSAAEQKELWTQEYEALTANILSLSPTLHEFLTRHLSCAAYFWASTIVTSRSFPSRLLQLTSSSESEPILLPGVDMFNHKRGFKIEWRPINLDSRIRKIEIVSLEDQIKPGEQVFNNYGPKSTAEFILGYGFALGEDAWKYGRADQLTTIYTVNNPDDFYTIKLVKPTTPHLYSPVITSIFDRFEPESLTHHIKRDGVVPSLLLAQLRISVISTPEEVEQVTHKFQHAMKLEPCDHKSFLDSFISIMSDSKLSWENELNCLDCLTSMIQVKLDDLSQINYTFETNSESPEIREPVKRMIRVYGKGQHDILVDTLKNLDALFQMTIEHAKHDGFQFDLDEED